MKTLFSIALLVIIGCSRVPVEPDADGYPVIKFIEIEKNEYEILRYKFQLLKDGDEGELYYSGYATESPIYKILIKTDNGWEEQGIGWCGTGLEHINLQTLPDTTPLIVYDPETTQAWKLGITFYKKVAGEFNWDNSVTIWSDEVPSK